MNLNCDLVTDCVSLYKDGALSATTAESIKKHLKECPSCRKYYRQYDVMEHMIIKQSQAEAINAEYSYADLSKKMRRSKTLRLSLMAGCTGITAAVVFIGLFYHRKNQQETEAL